jgi:hypothetical protein
MALADYRLCDVCGGKAFYDAHLNYEFREQQPDKSWVYPEPTKTHGTSTFGDPKLDYVGDWAVICRDCSKNYRTAVLLK